jgi:hypothetical protein
MRDSDTLLPADMNDSNPVNLNATAVVSSAKRKRRSRVGTIVGLILLAGVFFIVGRKLIANFKEINWGEVHVQPLFVVLAILSLLAARLCNALNCRLLLAALGVSIPSRRILPVIWLASLGRYLPGKMAVVAGSVVMLVRLGIRLPVALAALSLSTALMILLGLIAATPLLFTPAIRGKLPSGPILAGIMLVLGFVCLYPPIFLRLCNAGLKAFKREPLPERMRMAPFCAAIGVTMLRCGFLGLGLWLAARALIPISIGAYPQALASAGLASVIGFLAVFAPAGLGVHEWVYQATMESLLGPPVGLLVVMFRAFHILADAIAGAAGTALLKVNAGIEAALPSPSTLGESRVRAVCSFDEQTLTPTLSPSTGRGSKA